MGNIRFMRLMKYKIGDKVIIKTWKEMEKEYGLRENRFVIDCLKGFTEDMENQLNEYYSDRILTIKDVEKDFYSVKEIFYNWHDDMIEGLVKEEILDPINSRFEILDL